MTGPRPSRFSKFLLQYTSHSATQARKGLTPKQSFFPIHSLLHIYFPLRTPLACALSVGRRPALPAACRLTLPDRNPPFVAFWCTSRRCGSFNEIKTASNSNAYVSQKLCFVLQGAVIQKETDCIQKMQVVSRFVGIPRRRVKLLVDNTHPWPWLENPDGATCRVSSYSLETRDSLAMCASSVKPPEAHAREMPTHVKGGKTAAGLAAVVISGRDHGSKETF